MSEQTALLHDQILRALEPKNQTIDAAYKFWIDFQGGVYKDWEEITYNMAYREGYEQAISDVYDWLEERGY